MKIEHMAFQVDDPGAMSDWYCEHLGFTVKRAADEPVPVRFIADDTGQVMLEVYNNPEMETPDYASIHPLIIHLAFVCDKIPETVERLQAAGAVLFSGPETAPSGDKFAMLRDPWGLPIQLCSRAEPMI